MVIRNVKSPNLILTRNSLCLSCAKKRYVHQAAARAESAASLLAIEVNQDPPPPLPAHVSLRRPIFQER
jgi:hypothetical protein